MKNSTSLILLLISIGLFYTFISPHYDTVGTLRAQSGKYEDILASVSALTATRDDLSVKLANMPPTEVAKLEKILPDNVDTVNLAMTFDSIAARYGISIKSVRTVEVKTDTGTGIVQASANPYEKVTVSFSFVSTYPNFRKFMADIEQSLRIIDVKSVTFQATDSGLYEYQVSVDTYWLK
ncbi:type 4a pilus biogenesis protein PilO [Candidatus Parcubacteria bacterium]|nr:type 4a pilus biogenesis protein PilO [Candidatus Parcubacteria bacterium]